MVDPDARYSRFPLARRLKLDSPAARGGSRRKSRFTESRIVAVLNEAAARVPISELVPKRGTSRNLF